MQKSTQKNLKTTLYDFILGGGIIALSGYFIRQSNTRFGGFLYGALPIGFVYLYLLTYYTEGQKACFTLTKEVLIATLLFSVFILITGLLTPLINPLWCLAIATVIFVLAAYIYFKLTGLSTR